MNPEPAHCPRCGVENEPLWHIIVNGAHLNVCGHCVEAMEQFYPNGVEFIDLDD
jgi:ribosome-binding protein aMBF1 (putative translation factor)